VLVAAIALARATARKLGGGPARGFIARRGFAETVALIVVAATAVPLAGVIDFLLNGGVGSLGTLGWVAIGAILAGGFIGWRLTRRVVRPVRRSAGASVPANDSQAAAGRKVA